MQAIGACTRTWELIDRQSKMPLKEEPIDNAIAYYPNKLLLSKDIRFEKVTFEYESRPKHKVFEELDLVVPGGKKLALLGESGSGKSTLNHLLLRFYDPTEGCIKIGGLDLRRISPKWLRMHIASVSQEPGFSNQFTNC
jgi:ABC-type multidrug transport system fused ATPase/permease subunit